MIEAILFFLGMTVVGLSVCFFLMKRAQPDPYDRDPFGLPETEKSRAPTKPPPKPVRRLLTQERALWRRFALVAVKRAQWRRKAKNKCRYYTA